MATLGTVSKVEVIRTVELKDYPDITLKFSFDGESGSIVFEAQEHPAKTERDALRAWATEALEEGVASVVTAELDRRDEAARYTWGDKKPKPYGVTFYVDKPITKVITSLFSNIEVPYEVRETVRKTGGNDW